MNVFKNAIALCSIVVLLIVAGSCKSSAKKVEADNTVTIRLRSLTDIKIQSPSTIITLYGYDTSIADTKASVVAKKTVLVTEVPLDITIAIPKKPESMITPTPVAAAYYLDLYCDANKNNIRDTGDLIIDNSKGLPAVDVTNKEAQVFFLRQL